MAETEQQPYSLEQDLRVLATRRKNREWLRGHSIDLAHQARLQKEDLPFIYRLKEAILPVKEGDSFGPKQENGKKRFLKRVDGTYFDREKHKNLYENSEETRNNQWNSVYNATLPTNNALARFADIRNAALARLNVQNQPQDIQLSALQADNSYRKEVNKFLNRYNV